MRCVICHLVQIGVSKSGIHSLILIRIVLIDLWNFLAEVLRVHHLVVLGNSIPVVYQVNSLWDLSQVNILDGKASQVKLGVVPWVDFAGVHIQAFLIDGYNFGRFHPLPPALATVAGLRLLQMMIWIWIWKELLLGRGTGCVLKCLFGAFIPHLVWAEGAEDIFKSEIILHTAEAHG